jgi:hypothetical protein
MKIVFYFTLITLFIFACQKEKSISINPEVIAFVEKYNEQIKQEPFAKKEKYIIAVYVENIVDTVKINTNVVLNWESLIAMGKPSFEYTIEETKVYIYLPQNDYLFQSKEDIKFDPTYFKKNDTLSIHCMIPNLTLKRFQKDSIVTYEGYNSPTFIKLAPPPPPPPKREVKFEPVQIY